MKNIIKSMLIMTSLIMTGCDHEPDVLDLAACNLEVKFAEPTNSSYQCGSEVDFVAKVTNRSTGMCRRGAITLVRNGENGSFDVVGKSQTIPRLGGGQNMLFEFPVQELLEGEVNYSVTVANGFDVVLPPEDTIALGEDGVADGNEDNNSQSKSITYTSVTWDYIDGLLSTIQPTIAPIDHPDGLLESLMIHPDHTDIQDLLSSAGKEACTDCHTEPNWGTLPDQVALTQSINNVRTHPEDQQPKINCLQCHDPYSSGDETWISGSWGELPDGVSCKTCHGDVFHAWQDFNFSGQWSLFESNYVGIHPGDEIWIDIIKPYGICGDYEG